MIPVRGQEICHRGYGVHRSPEEQILQSELDRPIKKFIWDTDLQLKADVARECAIDEHREGFGLSGRLGSEIQQ